MKPTLKDEMNEELKPNKFADWQNNFHNQRPCEHCFCQTEMVGGSVGVSYAKPGVEHEKCCMCGTRRKKL